MTTVRFLIGSQLKPSIRTVVVVEILSLKDIVVMTLTFRVSDVIGHVTTRLVTSFPESVQCKRTDYLARFPRY